MDATERATALARTPRQRSRRVRSGVLAFAAAALLTSFSTPAVAAEPATIGSDGDYRYVTHWSTQYMPPDDAVPRGGNFAAPTNGIVGADGSLYVIANMSSGSSTVIQRYDTSTGEILARFGVVGGDPGDEYYNTNPTGLWPDPDGSIWVIGNGPNRVLTHFSASGTALSQVTISTSDWPLGLVRLPDGRFATVLVLSAGGTAVATIDASTGVINATPLPDGTSISYAMSQLNITPDGKLLWTGNQNVYTVNPDGSDLTDTPAPDVTQATVGADGRLYTITASADIIVRDTADPSAPGRQIAYRESPAFTPVMPMSTYGITAGIDGTVYVLGYYYPSSTDPDNTMGVIALRQVHSPVLQSNGAYTLSACRAFTSDAPVATGTPTPSWFAITGGELPPGLTLDPETGVISGTTTAVGDWRISLRASNGVTPATGVTTDTASITLTVTAASFTPGDVTVTGTPHVGQTLTADAGSWTPTPDNIEYQWLRDGNPITGATADRYVVQTTDAGHAISVRVSVQAQCTTNAAATSTALNVASGDSPSTTSPSSAVTATPPASTATLARTGGDQPWGWAALGVLMVALGAATFALSGRLRRG